jgi:hypothetical protein
MSFAILLRIPFIFATAHRRRDETLLNHQTALAPLDRGIDSLKRPGSTKFVTTVETL